MSSYELAPAAARDLEEILDHIRSEAGPERAESVRRELLSAIDRLSRYPQSGHARTDLTQRQVLFWPVQKWLIIYQCGMRTIQVVRVLSGWRDLRAILGRP